MKALSLMLIFIFNSFLLFGQESSLENSWLRKALTAHPAADINRDGILTMEEELSFRDGRTSVPTLTLFEPTPGDLQNAIEMGRAQNSQGPLAYEKSKGYRILMTGHSWVRPAEKTLPLIAEAAGYTGHHQRGHLSGGATGAANAIWKKEFGQYGHLKPLPVLVPAIETGKWDVMTWGSYYGDQPEFYLQWIRLCLEYNPNMVFFIQDGWPRPDFIQGNFREMGQEQVLDSLTRQHIESQEAMKALYEQLNLEVPGRIHIIPAGSAVVEIINRFFQDGVEGLECLDERTEGETRGIFRRDAFHLSLTSGIECMLGYLYYGMIYRQSPELIGDFQPEGVPVELDVTFREVAWKAITESPFSGIRDEDRDGKADEL